MNLNQHGITPQERYSNMNIEELYLTLLNLDTDTLVEISNQYTDCKWSQAWGHIAPMDEFEELHKKRSFLEVISLLDKLNFSERDAYFLDTAYGLVSFSDKDRLLTYKMIDFRIIAEDILNNPYDYEEVLPSDLFEELAGCKYSDKELEVIQAIESCDSLNAVYEELKRGVLNNNNLITRPALVTLIYFGEEKAQVKCTAQEIVNIQEYLTSRALEDALKD